MSYSELLGHIHMLPEGQQTQFRAKERGSEMTPSIKIFNVGQLVAWTSQSQGSVKRKVGKVIAVVPAGEVPVSGNPKDFGGPRQHESYLVEVTAGVRTTIYWPRVWMLEEA